MIKRCNRQSLIFGVSGIVLRFSALVPVLLFPAHSAVGGSIAVIMFALGTGLLFTGLVYYAKAKGRSGAFALLGLFDLLGIIILASLKDLDPESSEFSDPVSQCPSCGAEYKLNEYNPEAEHIYCSFCKAELPRKEIIANQSSEPTRKPPLVVPER